MRTHEQRQNKKNENPESLKRLKLFNSGKSVSIALNLDTYLRVRARCLGAKDRPRRRTKKQLEKKRCSFLRNKRF